MYEIFSVSGSRFTISRIKSNQIKMLKTPKNRLAALAIGISALCIPLSSCYYKQDKELLSSGPAVPETSLNDVVAKDSLDVNSSTEAEKSVDFYSKFYKLLNFLNVNAGTICMRQNGCREYYQDGINSHKALFCDKTDSGYSGSVYLTNNIDDNTINMTSIFTKKDLSKNEELTLKNDTLYISSDNGTVKKIYKTKNTDQTKKFVYDIDGVSDTIIIKNESFPNVITFNATVSEEKSPWEM